MAYLYRIHGASLTHEVSMPHHYVVRKNNTSISPNDYSTAVIGPHSRHVTALARVAGSDSNSWDGEVEGRSLIKLAFHPDASGVLVDDQFGD